MPGGWEQCRQRGEMTGARSDVREVRPMWRDGVTAARQKGRPTMPTAQEEQVNANLDLLLTQFDKELAHDNVAQAELRTKIEKVRTDYKTAAVRREGLEVQQGGRGCGRQVAPEPGQGSPGGDRRVQEGRLHHGIRGAHGHLRQHHPGPRQPGIGRWPCRGSRRCALLRRRPDPQLLRAEAAVGDRQDQGDARSRAERERDPADHGVRHERGRLHRGPRCARRTGCTG